MPKVLVVEDDATMAEMVAYNLRRHGFEVDVADNGKTALRRAGDLAVSLIILDVMLPDLDGIQIAGQVRRARPHVPLLILTARGEEEMKLRGFEAGVDDYLTKPFSMDELVARVKALLRRASPGGTASDEAAEIAFGDMRLAPRDFRVWIAGEEITLRPKEFSLLATLAREPGRLFTRDEISRTVWGYDALDTRTIDTHVKNVRRKIEDHSEYRYIETVRGVGYRFRVTPRAAR